MGSMDPSEAAEGIAGELAEALSYVLVPKTELEAAGGSAVLGTGT